MYGISHWPLRRRLAWALAAGASFGLYTTLQYIGEGLSSLLSGLIALILTTVTMTLMTICINPIAKATNRLGGSSLSLALAVGSSIGIAIGLTPFIIQGPPEGLQRGLILGISFGVTFGLIAGLFTALALQIRTVEIVNWDWKPGFLTGATIGIVITLLNIGLLDALGTISDPIDGLRTGIVFGFLAGLSWRDISQRTDPYQGLRRSARNAVAILAGGILCGIVAKIVAGDPALAITGSTIGIFGALRGGLAVCIQHVLLRWRLVRSGMLPSDPIRFLNYAAERLLVYRTGGGYIFAHRLLLDYIAGSDISTNSAEAHPPQSTS